MELLRETASELPRSLRELRHRQWRGGSRPCPGTAALAGHSLPLLLLHGSGHTRPLSEEDCVAWFSSCRDRWAPRVGLLVSFSACVLVTLLRFPHLLGTRLWVFFFLLLLFFNQFQKKMICVKGVKIEFIYDKLKLRRRIPEEATGS